jgi:HEAT repeat protein
MLRDLVAYLVALAKRWVLWAVLLLDLAGLVAVVVARPFEGSNTPRWIFLAVAAFGFAWTLLEIMETDPDRLRQRWAAGTLGRLGNPDAVEPLASLLVNDPDIVRRGWAAEALGEIGSPLAVRPLSAVLSSLDDVRHNTPEMGRHQKVARALGRIGDPSGVPALEQVYQRARGGELEFLRHAIAQALREMSCEEAARARQRLDIKEE